MNVSADAASEPELVCLADRPALRDGGGRGWGPWRLDANAGVLYPVAPYRYEIDLQECTSSARVLDWICQVAGKEWADDATLAGLVRAFGDVLVPQATLCSSGESKRLSSTWIRRRVALLGMGDPRWPGEHAAMTDQHTHRPRREPRGPQLDPRDRPDPEQLREQRERATKRRPAWNRARR